MKINIVPYACDSCGKRRDQDANSWLVLIASNARGDVAPPNVTIYRWSETAAVDSDAAHACGMEHAQLLFARWLDHGTFEEKLKAKKTEEPDGTAEPSTAAGSDTRTG